MLTGSGAIAERSATLMGSTFACGYVAGYAPRAELYAIHCVLRILIRMRILRILFGHLCIAGIRSHCVSNGVSESGQKVCIPLGQKCVILQIHAKIHNVAFYCTQHFYLESNFPINHQHPHTARPLAPGGGPPDSFARFCLA